MVGEGGSGRRWGQRALPLLGSSMCVTIVCVFECSTCAHIHGHTHSKAVSLDDGLGCYRVLQGGRARAPHTPSEVLRWAFGAQANISEGETSRARGGWISL